MKRALAPLSIMQFVSAWNDYLRLSLVMKTNTHALTQIGIRNFLGQEDNNWGTIMAEADLACTPSSK